MDEIGFKLVAADGATFTGTLKTAQDATESFSKATEAVAPKVSGAGEIMKGALRELGSIATNAALEAGQAIIKFGVDSIKTAADFEAGMGRFSAVAGDISKSGLTIDDFRNKFLQLGKDTQFSATQAQDAMTELVKGGVDVKSAYGDATQATLDLAAATKMDLAQAAEIVAKQLGVWSDTGLTATQAVNLLNQAADASTVNVDDLALGLSNSAGTAKTAGVSYNDLVTTMALIAPGFSSAADAGTSLKTFLTRLIPTTAEQTAAMVDLGLATANGKSAFYDAQGNFVGMEKAAQMLKEATVGLTQEQRLSYFNTIFGNDAIRAASILTEKGAEGVQGMAGAMDAQGTASEKAAKLNKGFNFAMEQLSGSLETLQIIIGSALLPVLTELINNVVVPAVNKIMEFATAFTSAGDSSSVFTAAISQIFPVSDEVRWTFESIKETIETVMAAVQDVVLTVVALITEFWKENGKDILADVEYIWYGIVDIIDLVMQLINKTVVPALKAIAKFINEHGDEIKSIFKNVWTIIKTIIDTVLTLISGIIRIALALVNGDTEKALDILKETFAHIWDNIKTIIGAALDNIKIALGLALGAMLTNITTKMGEFFTAISTAFNNILNFITGIYPSFLNVGVTIGNKIREGFDAVAGSIRDGVGNAISAAAHILDGASNLISNLLSLGSSIVQKVVDGIINSAHAIADAVWNAVQTAINNAKNAILGFIKNPLGALTGGGDGAGSSSFNGPNTDSASASAFLPWSAPVAMPATAGQAMATTYAQNYSRTYQLNINSGQSTSRIAGDFAIMEALARA